ncbi:hypothetical protein B7463_g3832, partial [Scytalidium lignicola]
MVLVNLDSKEPSGPSQSATQVGWDYHLIIKGFSCSNRPGSVSLNVGEFLYKLFNEQNLIPLKYGYHTIAEGAGGQAGRTLLLSFALEDGASMSLDAALRTFCHKFFDTSDHAAYQQLSRLGMYGFSPQEDKMKYFWYEAMFKWMGSYRKEKLAGIEADLAAVGNSGTLASWVPSWRGGLLFALTLSLSWGATRVFGAPFEQGGVRLEVIEAINGIMMSEAARKERDGYDTSQLARPHCQKFVRIMEDVVTILNLTPTENRSQMQLHRDVTVHLIGLFESGYEAVTVCTDAVLSFQRMREAHTMCVVFSAMQTATAGFNMNVLLDAAMTTPIPRSVFLGPGVTLVISIAQLIFSGIRTYQTEKQRKKWATITLYIAASMKIAQGCECYLRWTYNSGVTNGEHSPQYYNELRNLMQASGGSEPLPEDCNPNAVRARLEQYAETLSSQKEMLNALLN